MIVAKFGGTSMQDAEAIRRAATIIGERRDRSPLVVVSAVAGATDELLGLAEVAQVLPKDTQPFSVEQRRAEIALRQRHVQKRFRAF